MCWLAPRLTSAAPESRIHIHTLSDVTEITGPPGEFRVTAPPRPRYVNEKCVGCGECVAVCPVTYPNEFDFGVSERTAIDRPFANAVPCTFAVDRKGWSPCKTACPVHTSAHGYVALVAKGRFEEAYRVASEPNPFPQRLRPHLHARLRDRVHARQRGGAHRHRRHQALRGRHARRPSCRQRGAGLLRRARGHRRRRPRRPHRGPRARALRLQGHRVRGAARGRRHAARRHPRVPPAARGPAGRDRPRHWRSASSSDRAGAAARTSPSTRLFADGYKAVFLATGLHQSKDLPHPGSRPAGRRPRRRVPAGPGARRARRPRRQARRRDRRRRRGLRRRPDRLPLRRRRAADPGLHRGRAHGAGHRRRGRGGPRGAGPRRVLLLPAEILGRGGTATGVKFQRCTLGEPNERGWRPPVPVEGSSTSSSRPTPSSSPSARRSSTTSCPARTASPSSTARSAWTPTR